MDDGRYVAHKPEANGHIPYTKDEHVIWSILYKRQIEIIRSRACSAYLLGLEQLDLSADQIPQPNIVSSRLEKLVGWRVETVPALINFQTFFELLANKRFPAASFIRRYEDLEYLKEPDIFHEIFGHCPLLTNHAYAAFTQEVGRFGATLSHEDQVRLGRLYWFTVEFGLIRESHGLRIYGGGILSSKIETVYALESDKPMRKPFDLIEVLRMPYRYDELQKVYYIVNSFDELYNMVNGKLLAAFKEAKSLGMLPKLS